MCTAYVIYSWDHNTHRLCSFTADTALRIDYSGLQVRQGFLNRGFQGVWEGVLWFRDREKISIRDIIIFMQVLPRAANDCKRYSRVKMLRKADLDDDVYMYTRKRAWLHVIGDEWLEWWMDGWTVRMMDGWISQLDTWWCNHVRVY